MSLFSILKNNSKLALRGKWGRAIGGLAIFLGASILLSALQTAVINLFVEPVSINPSLAMRFGFAEYFFEQFLYTSPLELAILCGFTLISFLFFSPLSLGLTHWYYEVVCGRNPSISEIFRFFESGQGYGRSLWLNINLAVRTYLWAILFYIVPGGLFGVSVFVTAQGAILGYSRSVVALASVGILLACVLLLLATVFYSAFMNRYLLAAYLVCENELTVRQAIKTSIAFTKGYRFSLFGYQLSFIGWAILCVVFFPILYVFPYMNTAVSMYARYIIERGRYTPPNPTREFAAGHPEEFAKQAPSTNGSADFAPGPVPEAPQPPEAEVSPGAPSPQPSSTDWAPQELDDFQFPNSRIVPSVPVSEGAASPEPEGEPPVEAETVTETAPEEAVPAPQAIPQPESAPEPEAVPKTEAFPEPVIAEPVVEAIPEPVATESEVEPVPEPEEKPW